MTTKTNWQQHAPQLPKGVPMPREIAHYEKRALMDQELLLEQSAEIQRLKMTINDLSQKRK